MVAVCTRVNLAGQAGVPLQPAQPQAHDWAGPARQHTIVFDYKPDEPGLGKSGKGVLSVDGKEVAKNSMEHGTPVTFPEDESFDIGSDTRTGVAMLEYRYESPFKFTGTIDKLTFKLEPEPEPAPESKAELGPTAAPEPDPIDTEAKPASDPKGLETDAMKKVLLLAAVGEVATGLALLIVPSLVGRLLLGAELTGVAIPVARVLGIALIALGVACWPGRTPLCGMLTYSAAVTLYLGYVGFAGRFGGILLWPAVIAHADPDGTSGAGITKRQTATGRRKCRNTQTIEKVNELPGSLRRRCRFRVRLLPTSIATLHRGPRGKSEPSTATHHAGFRCVKKRR